VNAPAAAGRKLVLELPASVRMRPVKRDQLSTTLLPDGRCRAALSHEGNGNSFYVQAGEDAPEEFVMRVALETSDGGIQTEKTYQVHVLPPLPDRQVQPKKFWIMPYGFARATDDPSLHDDLAELARRCGYNVLLHYWGDQVPVLEWAFEKAGIRAVGQVGEWAAAESAMQFPEEAFGRDHEGKRIVCPTYLLEHTEFYEQWSFAEYRRIIQPACFIGADNDYEPRGIYACFDDRCLAAFAEWAGLPREQVTPESVLREFRAKWTDFRVWQNSQYVRGELVSRRLRDRGRRIPAHHRADGRTDCGAGGLLHRRETGRYSRRRDRTAQRGLHVGHVGRRDAPVRRATVGRPAVGAGVHPRTARAGRALQLRRRPDHLRPRPLSAHCGWRVDAAGAVCSQAR